MSYSGGDMSFTHGVNVRSFSSNLSRTATSAAELFTLPPYSVVKQVTVIGAKSDAGTSARISLGSSGGAGTEFLSQFNVKANGTVSYPSSFAATVAAADPNPIIVTGVYAEDGDASTAGGPWTIIFDVIGTDR